MRIFKAKEDYLKQIEKDTVAAIGIKSAEDKNAFRVFLRNFFRSFPYENMERQGTEVLTLQLSDLWKRLQKRPFGKSFLHIESFHLPGRECPRVLINTINDDSSFIVDSVQTFLENLGLDVEYKSHPVLNVSRDQYGKLIDIANDFSDDSYRSESVVWIQIKASLSKQEIDKLRADLEDLLVKIRDVVGDWQPIRHTLYTLSNQAESLENILADSGTKKIRSRFLSKNLSLKQIYSFLRWLDDKHFIFLGSRYFKAKESKTDSSILCMEPCKKSPKLGLFKHKSIDSNADVAPSFQRTKLVADKKDKGGLQALTIFKTNLRSQVHRPSRIDSVEVVDFDADGNAKGVYQFIGVLTNLGYSRSAFEVPILKDKVKKVFQDFGLRPHWHDGKSLANIMDSIPQDELFQLEEEDIYFICTRVLQMSENGRLVSFIRPDKYGRQASIIVYIPRDHYSSSLKRRFGEIFCEELGGEVGSTNVLLGEKPYARVVYIISFKKPKSIKYDLEAIEEKLVEASLDWRDRLERHLQKKHNETQTLELFGKFSKAFPQSYTETFSPSIAAVDISFMERLSEELEVTIKFVKKDDKELRVKVFHKNKPLSLSNLLPILQNFGLQIITETPHCLKTTDGDIWCHSIEARMPKTKDWHTAHENLKTVFDKIWLDDFENDGFNHLILKANFSWQQVMLIRAYAKFLKQMKLPYSMPLVQETLSTHADITAIMVQLFDVRFNPQFEGSRQSASEKLIKKIQDKLHKVTRLDHDQVLNRFLNAILNTLRTNFYQAISMGRSYISFKFDSQNLRNIPLPKPKFIVFVYSPRMEAAHLRGGKVARGGIRWSDRKEDFYKEVLGLVKAQMVKNSVIIPSGSKGGFIVKHADNYNDRTELMEEVQECYRTMMRGLLDITDNIQTRKGGASEITPPPLVVRHDDDDPYLVVAADKGTATFSDIANGISQEYGFWLDDAFASGGSAGYDHKKMGITAKGAWESVKRHFREMGHNTQSDPFTVIGVGDMSGDVFGNGMLLSEQIKLVAAFNHLHIFIDPNPDPASSFKERMRLFELTRSNWTDYDTKVMSKGGRIYDRSAKSCKLTPEIKNMLGVRSDSLAPDELITAILRSKNDLLWFGGIGTYVKGRDESHTDVGDRSNDNIRINASELGVKVVGEGANLGMTQKARIEYALLNGRINTDAIDNSAGVDCSDHEVNIKILFSALESEGKVTRKSRDKLLEEMTDTVSDLVLRDNYLQTQIITFMHRQGSQGLRQFQTLMKILENKANLSRAVEHLPDDEAIDRRALQGQTLTRPELSVLLGYAKIALNDALIMSDLPDKEMYQELLYSYFPEVLQKKYHKEISQHRLKREIVANSIANMMINRAGPMFVYDTMMLSGRSQIDVTHAFFLAVHALGIEKLWQDIENLDSLMIADIQTQCLLELRKVVSMATLWFLHNNVTEPLIEDDCKIIQNLIKSVRTYLHKYQCSHIGASVEIYSEQGIDVDLAHRLSVMQYMPSFLDIYNISKKTGVDQDSVANVYFYLRDRFSLDYLMLLADKIMVEEEWQKTARAQIVDDLVKLQEQLTLNVVQTGKGQVNAKKWVDENEEIIMQITQATNTVKEGSPEALSLISFLVRKLQKVLN